MLGAKVEKVELMVDDRLSNFHQRVASLFDRVDQPLSRDDFLFDELFFFRSRLTVRQSLDVVLADVQAACRAFFHHDLVSTILFLNDLHIRLYRLYKRFGKVACRFWVQST